MQLLHTTLADIHVAYIDQGAGIPLLFVHGFPLDHSMWAAQVDVLAASACRVIAPDLRGFGRSSLGGADALAGISMEKYADDLAALLSELAIRERIILCGFSMGGYIAFQFVRKYGELVRGLVLCDTRAAADTAQARAGRLKMAEHVAEWGAARVAEMMMPKLFAPTTFAQQPQLVEAIRQVVSDTTPAAIAAAQRGMAARPDMSGLLPQISVPSLVIVGEDDAISPHDEMHAMAAAIPGGRFAAVAAAGHMAPLENPTAVNQALQAFLNDQ